MPQTKETKTIKEPVDLLNRDAFVDQLVNISERFSDGERNACFALNAGWGVGKSFVLDLYEKKLMQIQSSKTTMGKYLIFRYNCWQYDYYEEPLIAIAAAMLDTVEEKVHLFSNDARATVKEFLKIIGEGLAQRGSAYILEKTGVDIEKLRDAAKDGLEQAEEAVQKAESFDTLVNFKRTLKRLKEKIEALAKDQTVVIIVDELDRCLPAYAIKVLERLHHVFQGIPNVQMILSVDKAQLENTVAQIFGSQTNVNQYLAKFVGFTVNLTEGSMNEQFEDRFRHYIANFTKNPDDRQDAIDVIRVLLEGVDIRNCIAIVERCHLIHQLCTVPNEPAFMCIEVYLALLAHWNIRPEALKAYLSERDPFGFAGLKEHDPQWQYPTGLRHLHHYFDRSPSPYRPLEKRRNDSYANKIPSVLLDVHQYIVAGKWGGHISALLNAAELFWRMLESIA